MPETPCLAVLYAREPNLPVAEFRRVLAESGLGALRPVDDTARLQAMLDGAGLIVTARLDSPGHPLVGIARVTLVLISVDGAVGFYERVGMSRLDTAFWRQREQ